ncbi:MAG: hypothetical protein LBG74_06745 [Spirochaetaceae bacterium]|jgi:hypothetical protein|nr:hypothetical protein [Spirochaetaceae bacterium]
MDIAKLFEKHKDEAVFVKTTVSPCAPDRKVTLNRKGNMLFNSGDVEEARRIFMTTGYSDGLSRVGDFYKSHGRLLDALRMYKLAPNPKRITELSMEFAILIKGMLGDTANDH